MSDRAQSEPGGPNLPNQLFDVLARSASDVWAVGEQGSSGSALILRFDGTRWQPVPNNCGSGLRGITDVPVTDTLWAVGENTTCFFDGQQWSPVPQPGIPDLEGVSAVSASDVWAAGFEVFCDPFTCYSQSVIQRWNGSQWRAVPQPLASELTDIEVVTGADVWAVGTNNVGTVIQHWDGARWTDVPNPDPDDAGRLDAIDAQGGGTMWSAGAFYGDDSDQRTLTLQAPSSTQGQVVGKTNVGQSPVSWFGPVTGTTTTDVFGSYSIAGLPAGTYILTVTYAFPGTCDPQSARITVVANQTTVQDFQLDC